MGKKVHYIDNKRFEEIIPLYLNNREDYEDDAKQECFLLILKTLKNFQSSKGSAFNYFTTVIVNNLKLLYTKNKKYENKILQYRELKSDYKPNSS